MDSPDALITVSPTEQKLGFFKRLRSRFRRSVSPSSPTDSTTSSQEERGLRIQHPMDEPLEQHEQHEQSPTAEDEIEASGTSNSKITSLNPFKRKKKNEDEYYYYEAVDHWTDDW